ncbi:unnamed protein product [Orchesella dallaii]|uniref:Uncharacterized protein n=1 Tax=Orchesella dallaii TaxID=48710 RepID=A0ABP1Q9B4_9HEXA
MHRRKNQVKSLPRRKYQCDIVMHLLAKLCTVDSSTRCILETSEIAITCKSRKKHRIKKSTLHFTFKQNLEAEKKLRIGKNNAKIQSTKSESNIERVFIEHSTYDQMRTFIAA